MPRKPKHYPYPDLDTLLGPVHKALATLLAGGTIPAGLLPGAVPFADPVGHVAAPTVPDDNTPGAVAVRLLQIAYQYGVCQGYALHRSESAERLKIARALEQTSRGLLAGAKKTVARGRRAAKPPGGKS